MTLREALLAANRPATAQPPYRLHLCCGFEPLHLISFLKAHLRNRLSPAGRGAEVAVGRFGDVAGNVERALTSEVAEPIAVVLEWADIDPRLGLREGYRPGENDEPAIQAEAFSRLDRLQSLLARGGDRRIVLALPSGPLPPWLPGMPGQISTFALRLRARMATLAAECSAAGVRVADSPAGECYDFRTHLTSGFPFPISYTDQLASSIAELLAPTAPKKGLVTDLDNTLWLGIVGDDGPENVHWSLEHQARIHGLYQQFLAAMAAQGVLVGIASKNDPGPVAEALARTDLLLSTSALFPVETNWGSKSESLRRIAQAWNIGLDAIVFVDDNPLELAEVQQALPEVECHAFPSADPAAALALLETLRHRFSREQVTGEDRLRAASLRNAAQLAEASQSNADPEALLAGLESRMVFEFRRDSFDSRAFELLNKTNQFNLNGQRWEESDFRRFLASPESVLCIASYEDRFGPLGKIAVAAGTCDGSTLQLKSWVISCRAFSRRVEFQTLQSLFNHCGVDTIALDWQSTKRNGPTRETLATLIGEVPDAGTLTLRRREFAERCPPLYAAAQALP